MIISAICSCCGAHCQEGTYREFKVKGDFHPFLRLNGVSIMQLFLCEFCLLDPDAPIPYVVTDKGITESKKRGGGRNHGA